ncbi:MAG: MFS transporter [Alicyclobacillus herbarius]|nr:MFS transporter [Alicyclobacillus herbarius]MCL6633828.1 MFS transporter [Alicyclobacillus herbarius]
MPVKEISSPAVGVTAVNRSRTRTRRRYVILTILFISTALNYLDRTNISVAGPFIKSDLHLNSVTLGLIFSAFGWTYALMQIPGGWVLDRLGPRLTYGLAMLFWSLFTLLQAFARSFAGLFGLRLGLGMSEAPAFPTNNRLVATWFPKHERAFATAVYTAGEYIGLAFLSPVLAWIVATYGWSAIFIVTGVIGLIWVPFWFRFIRKPEEARGVSQEELDYIRAKENLSEGQSRQKLGWADLAELFRHRSLWGIYIGQFAVTTTLWFFLTWFPTYLVNGKHMTILHVGFYSMIPYIAALLGVLCGGAVSDWLLRRGVSVGTARKTPIVVGLLLASVIVAANYTTSVPLVIAILSIAFFAQGLSAISWTMVGELAPARLMGLCGGVFNFAGNLSGIVTPIIIGVIVGSTNNFNGALLFVGAVVIIGALSYLFLVGKVERVVIRDSIREG